ncbi:MAG TPA: hypothetical protein VFZ67_04420 [Nitrososphaera sp.]
MISHCGNSSGAFRDMGMTIPSSFRIELDMEEAESKPFRNVLDKSDMKKFDGMFDLPRFYISSCSNSVQYVRDSIQILRLYFLIISKR